MSQTVTFDAGGTHTATVPTPEEGYVTETRMDMAYQERLDGSYGVHDSGATYDRYVLTTSRWVLTEAQIEDLNAIFSDGKWGRGIDVTLSLGATASGFFPFGPVKGDIGDFEVRVIGYKQSGQLLRPWKRWLVEMEILYVSGPTPAYSISDTKNEGGFRIGSVNGLMYPQAAFESETEYAIRHVVTYDGTPYAINAGPNSDSYIAQFVQQCNTGKAGSLADYLVGTARSGQFTVGARDSYYLFGRDQAASGALLVRSLMPTLRMVHVGFDRWEIPMKLRYEA